MKDKYKIAERLLAVMEKLDQFHQSSPLWQPLELPESIKELNAIRSEIITDPEPVEWDGEQELTTGMLVMVANYEGKYEVLRIDPSTSPHAALSHIKTGKLCLYTVERLRPAVDPLTHKIRNMESDELKYDADYALFEKLIRQAIDQGIIEVKK